MSRKAARAGRRAPAPVRASWWPFAWPAPPRTLFEPQAGHESTLDGLRGVSSIFVMVFHCVVWLPAALPDTYRTLPASLVGFWSQCWWGVDVFFVLSGFLIGRILLKRLQRGALGFRSFYARRAFRIFPVYYFVLTLSVFVFTHFESWSILYRTRTPEIIPAGSWANYLYISNYLYGMQLPNAMTWGWSLCVEEHFYLLLPAALALVFKFLKGGARALVFVPFTILPLLFRWRAYLQNPEESGFYWLHPLSHTHGEGLAIGVLIAYTYVFHHATVLRWVRRLGPLTWILGVACIGIAMRFGGLRTPGYFPVVWQYFIVAIGSALVLLNGLYLDNVFTRFLSWRLWIPLARMSYCTYLIQMYVIFLLLGWWPAGALGAGAATWSFYAFSAAVIVVASLFAGAIYLMLERPLLDQGGVVAAKYMPASKPAERIARTG